MNPDGVTVDHNIYMVRDPFGSSAYSAPWNTADAAWTSAYRV